MLDLDQIYTYHPPFGTQQERYVAIRSEAKNLAALVEKSCPPSREASLAQTAIQQAVMWANAAIAINEKEIKETASQATAASEAAH